MNKNSSILALDLGTHFGFALQKHSNPLFSGNKKLKADDSRYFVFGSWLDSMIVENNVSFITFEENVFMRGKATVRVFNGFRAIILYLAHRYNLPYEGIGVHTVKSFATGNSKATKEEMLAAAKIFNPKVKDDNEADAILILRCFINQHLQ